MNGTDQSNRHAPLFCLTRARLERQWRAAAEQDAGEAARQVQTLRHASLDEYSTLVANSSERHRAAELALSELQAHRTEHGC